MDPSEKDRIAQETYGKNFDELSTNEQKAVGGKFGGPKGGETRKQQMAETHGGDVHGAYSEMSKTQFESGEERAAAHQGEGQK